MRNVSYLGGPISAKVDYLKGRYDKAGNQKTSISTVAYKIGGLVFTGQHQQARVLFESFSSKLSLSDLVVARFHMGLSYTRTSEYQRAEGYFNENKKVAEDQNIQGIAGFYAYQGLSFYKFFFSAHSDSQLFAEKGYASLLLLESAPPLLLGLSLDIQGHNKIQMGEVHKGLKLLKEALRITKENELKELHSEIQISYLIYQSDFDTDLAKQIQALKKHLKKTDNQNDYSSSELVLQISKLLFLKGDFQSANEFIKTHFDFVYQNQNKRKIATLNTLMAQLMIHRGQSLEALSILNVAENYLNQNIDRSLFLPLLGLKISVLKQLKRNPSKEIQLSNELLVNLDRTINRKIQDRHFGEIKSRRIGEDQMGDLFDQVSKRNKGALKGILKYQIHILLFPFFDLKPGKKYIIACEQEETTLLIDHDGITNTGKPLSRLQLKLLNLLSEEAASKEKIIQEIWGYNYDILRHDPLIYTTMGRLRKALGNKRKWLYSDDQKYYLDEEVNLVFSEPIKSSPQKVASKKNPVFKNLNYRQIQFLSESDPTPLSVSEYGDKWQVTRMTALRDLKDLVEKNLLQRVGRGKSTRYFLNTF